MPRVIFFATDRHSHTDTHTHARTNRQTRQAVNALKIHSGGIKTIKLNPLAHKLKAHNHIYLYMSYYNFIDSYLTYLNSLFQTRCVIPQDLDTEPQT